MDMTNIKAMQILIVDDDDVARESFQRGVRHARLPLNVTEADDALEAYAILKGIHPEKTVETPVVVLLDLNMPRMSGFEFLEVIRKDEELCFTPVFVLTTSDLSSDKEKSFDLDVIGYMSKMQVGHRFENLLKELVTAVESAVE